MFTLLPPLDHPLKSTVLQEEAPPRRTLLIVDDEDGPRQSLRIVFKEDYNVLLAETGDKAIALVRENAVDAAVLDIRMGGMSGIEVLEKLKAADPTIEVIMLTAYETIDTIRQALRLGACEYLNKPFDLATMRAAVANAMERRTLSEEIRSNNQKLGVLQTELQNQRLQEEITRTRGEIYASIIHDINGPLTIISGFIQIINQRIGHAKHLEEPDLDLVKDRLKRITRQVTNCIEISQRYLSFMRQQSPENVRVRSNQILDDLRELLRVHPCAQNNELQVQTLREDLFLQVNGTDLIQILLNLAINAFQCTTNPHSVTIRGKAQQGVPDLNDLQDGPNSRVLNREGFSHKGTVLVLSVEDNGPGVPTEVLPKIFEPYFTTKAGEGGTGLGLSIVHRLIKEAQGILHLHTVPGQGTTFDLYLPAWSVMPLRG